MGDRRHGDSGERIDGRVTNEEEVGVLTESRLQLSRMTLVHFLLKFSRDEEMPAATEVKAEQEPMLPERSLSLSQSWLWPQ